MLWRTHFSNRSHYENEKPENQVAGVWATQYSFFPMRNTAHANSSFEIIPADKRKSQIFFVPTAENSFVSQITL